MSISSIARALPLTFAIVAGSVPKAHAQAPELIRIAERRAASGTAWQPEAAMTMGSGGASTAWQFHLHGAAFIQYDRQFGKRGAAQTGSVNWLMGDAARISLTSALHLRAMMSADPLTVTPRGYPLLLQTGEVYHRQPIHDRQHPHDLFMELAALYTRALSESLGAFLYLAPAGEPATGPIAYQHRPSAALDPFAPIGHHWQDETHISFGVATLGLYSRSVRIEGSAFNGREPDENRTNLDLRRAHLGSFSGRVTVNPSPRWSALVSYAFLKNPEPIFAQRSDGSVVEVSDRQAGTEAGAALDPRYHIIVAFGTPASSYPSTSVHRTVAAATYARPRGSGSLALSAIVTRQRHTYDRHNTLTALFEESISSESGSGVFLRGEIVQKTAGDLALPPPRPSVGIAASTAERISPRFLIAPVTPIPDYQARRFNIGNLVVGAVRAIRTRGPVTVGLGLRLSGSFLPSSLAQSYGSRIPLGTAIYIQLRPAMHKAEMAMPGM